MKEGWHKDEYLTIFEGSEIEDREKEYGIDQLLPGHRLLGLIGWDDFLVLDQREQKVFRVPTIPARLEERSEWDEQIDPEALEKDERYKGKIKWYVKPIIFGGDPNPGENLIWIDHQQHPELVRYWNQMYTEVSGRQ
jgi:hypothetical protein